MELSPDAAPREPRCHPATAPRGPRVSPCHGGVRGGDGEGCGSFLHAAGTCNSQEQSRLFWSKDTASFLCRLASLGGDGRELLALGVSATAAAKTSNTSPGARGSGVGSIPPAWPLQLEWGDLFPHLPFGHSWNGWKISTEEAPVRKSNKSQITLQTALPYHGSRRRRGAVHFPIASQNPCPGISQGTSSPCICLPLPSLPAAPACALCLAIRSKKS